MKRHSELLILLTTGLVFALILGLAFKSLNTVIKFMLAFFFLYYLPSCFYAAALKHQDFVSKFVLSLVLGLAFFPTVYFFAGLTGVRLNSFFYIAVSAVILIIGIFVYLKNPLRSQPEAEPKKLHDIA